MPEFLVTCLSEPPTSKIKTVCMPSKTEICPGLEQDTVVQAFQTAPLPSLPRRRQIFQRDDVNKTKAKISLAQFVERYHCITNAIDTGFGPKATLSPSAWLKSTSDLTTRILNGVLSTRVNLLNSQTPQDTGPLFNPEDCDTISQIWSNLDHLAKVFALTPDSPSLVCSHCLHRTDQNQARDILLEVDYMAILMATDCSRTAVLDQILSHISAGIQKEAETWYIDEGTC
jgi:hypothetical protein